MLSDLIMSATYSQFLRFSNSTGLSLIKGGSSWCPWQPFAVLKPRTESNGYAASRPFSEQIPGMFSKASKLGSWSPVSIKLTFLHRDRWFFHLMANISDASPPWATWSSRSSCSMAYKLNSGGDLTFDHLQFDPDGFFQEYRCPCA